MEKRSNNPEGKNQYEDVRAEKVVGFRPFKEIEPIIRGSDNMTQWLDDAARLKILCDRNRELIIDSLKVAAAVKRDSKRKYKSNEWDEVIEQLSHLVEEFS
ncbi:MAG: hypothetical protein F6K45_23145 [Kamptonema sp. SIO1D9]|nr:hypothetical protein [Kamptonema sp. SIO1D9]